MNAIKGYRYYFLAILTSHSTTLKEEETTFPLHIVLSNDFQLFGCYFPCIKTSEPSDTIKLSLYHNSCHFTILLIMHRLWLNFNTQKLCLPFLPANPIQILCQSRPAIRSPLRMSQSQNTNCQHHNIAVTAPNKH